MIVTADIQSLVNDQCGRIVLRHVLVEGRTANINVSIN